MPSRRNRPPIPVTLTLPAQPPTPVEIDAMLMTVDAPAGQAHRGGAGAQWLAQPKGATARLGSTDRI